MSGGDLKPWSQPVEAVAVQLGANEREGLGPSEVADRRRVFGINAMEAGQKTSAFRRFLNQFKSPVVIILIVATVVSALLGEVADAIAIVSIVMLNAFIGYFQEAKAEAAVEALKKLAAPRTRVLRSCEIAEIASDQVVPGDVLVFEAGDYVASDARIFLANQLSVDEAVLTGESLPVAKALAPVAPTAAIGDRTNMIFAGTAISTGSGRALVTAIGMRTEIGRIAGLLEGEKKVTCSLKTGPAGM